jgi:hypothetical protein
MSLSSLRRENRPRGPVILPPPFFGGLIGLWYWIYLSQLESTIDETVSKAALGRHKNMSLSSLRCRENRVRDEIYKEHLKHGQPSSDGASLHGSNRTNIELDGQTPDDQPAHCMPDRRKKRPLGRGILPPPFLGGSIGLWYWTFLSHRQSTVDEQQ